MDLLDSILRSANAEDYIETLKNNNIDASTLPALTENDLEVIGVDNPDIRKEIVKKSANLQIPHEKRIDLEITEEYCELVLNQISHQLLPHLASLACASIRRDLIVCNIQLHSASQCLCKTIRSLKLSLDQYETKFGPVKKKRVKRKDVLIIAGSCAITVFVIGKLVLNI